MFEAFATAFPLTSRRDGPSRTVPVGAQVPGISELLSKWAGAEFCHGLYRFHDETSGTAMDAILREYLPRSASGVFCFAYDWAGKQFALNLDPATAADAPLRIYDAATCEAFDVPVDVVDFHNSVLNRVRESTLQESLYEAFRRARGMKAGLPWRKVVGLNRPLQLGGEYVLSNLDIQDMEVYWDISAQIAVQVNSLAPGTRVTRVELGG